MPMEVVAQVDPRNGHVEARTIDGHLVVMDADPPDGLAGAAGPKEALLAALAGCTAIDVTIILRKKRQTVESYEIAVSGISAREHPQIFTDITVEHRVSGAVEAEALRRSIELSATRYCPVNAMLSAVARIEHHYRLVGSDGGVRESRVAVVGPERRIEVD